MLQKSNYIQINRGKKYTFYLTPNKQYVYNIYKGIVFSIY